MNCQRCFRGQAVYRAHTDAMDIKLCPVCAEEAQRLKIAVEVLRDGERKTGESKGSFESADSTRRAG